MGSVTLYKVIYYCPLNHIRPCHSWKNRQLITPYFTGTIRRQSFSQHCLQSHSLTTRQNYPPTLTPDQPARIISTKIFDIEKLKYKLFITIKKSETFMVTGKEIQYRLTIFILPKMATNTSSPSPQHIIWRS